MEKQIGECLKVDNSVNYSRFPESIAKSGNISNAAFNREEETCFDDSDWCDSAANAIGEEFDNMDGFLDKFIKSTSPPPE